MGEAELMRAVQMGDRAALEQLVHRYHRPLLAYFYRLSGDYHLAQDLAQECLIRLVARAELYRYPEPLRPWLYRIATNIWRDHAKSVAYRHARDQLPWTEAGAGTAPPPDEAVAERLLGQEVLAAVRRLPPEFTEVLLLRFGQELTVPEIAAVLGLPEGTVKSRIYHGLRHLRTKVQAEPERSTPEGREMPHARRARARSAAAPGAGS